LAVKNIKKKEGENLSDTNIEKVIQLLEAEKPITKKEACEILSIAYNTTRLAKIVADYKDRQELDKKRRAANRGKPATDYEISSIVEEYLLGEGIKNIADSLFRPTNFVKNIIEELGVPSAQSGETYFDFSALPEQCIAEKFTPGEFVWSSRYNSIAEVIKSKGTASDGSGVEVYSIYVYQRVDPDKMLIDGQRYSYMPETKFGGYYCCQRAYDLGSLKHLEKFIPDMKKIIK